MTNGDKMIRMKKLFLLLKKESKIRLMDLQIIFHIIYKLI